MGTNTSSLNVDISPREIDINLLNDLRVASNWTLPNGEMLEQEYTRLVCMPQR